MKIQPNIIFPWCLCIIVTVFALWLLYKLIDQFVTLDHQMQYTKLIEDQRNLLVHFFNAADIQITEKKTRTQLRKVISDPLFMFDKGKNEVVADQVSFYFKDGSLDYISVGEEVEGKDTNDTKN